MRATRRIVARALALGSLWATIAACEEPFDRVSLLQGYRLLALESPTPAAAPDGELVVTARDHDTEADRPRSYTYTLCPYSFGSGAGYACLVPETEVTLPASADPTLRVDLATQAFGPHVGLTEALKPAAAELSRQLAAFDADAPPVTVETLLALGVDLWVKVESGPEGARQQSVRSVLVRYPQAQRCALTAPLGGIDPATLVCAQTLTGAEREAAQEAAQASEERYVATAQCCSPDNVSPGLEALEIEGLDAEGRVPAGQKVTLQVVPAEDARQFYWQDDRTRRCPNSDRSINVDGGPCREELYYRWYASGGEFKPGVTFESDAQTDRDTEWTAPDEPGEVQLFVVAFDGRGGVTALPRRVTVVAPSR